VIFEAENDFFGVDFIINDQFRCFAKTKIGKYAVEFNQIGNQMLERNIC